MPLAVGLQVVEEVADGARVEVGWWRVEERLLGCSWCTELGVAVAPLIGTVAAWFVEFFARGLNWAHLISLVSATSFFHTVCFKKQALQKITHIKNKLRTLTGLAQQAALVQVFPAVSFLKALVQSLHGLKSNSLNTIWSSLCTLERSYAMTSHLIKLTFYP